MAEAKVLVCDRQGQRPCSGRVETWLLTPEGEGSRRVDLCPTHSRALVDLWGLGVPSDGPAKKRHEMQAVTLKTTPRTRALKVK